MGRQLGIYFTVGDAQNFLDFAKTTGDVVALPWNSPTSNFNSIDRIDDETRVFFLFNRGISSNLVTQYVAQQRYHVLDHLQSSVVEFSGSPISDQTMFPGRIWADFTFLNKERTALVPKEQLFSKWYNTIAGWIKTRSERVVWADPAGRKTSVIGYAGEGAQKFYDSGGRFCINSPIVAKPQPDEKELGRILYRKSDAYKVYVENIARRRLVPRKDKVRLTCQLCGDRFQFGSKDILHKVREDDWTIYCPKVCPGCGEKRKLHGGVYPPTHSCGWDVMLRETYKQRDYASIEKNELQRLMKYLGEGRTVVF